jgi:hypothetical protein
VPGRPEASQADTCLPQLPPMSDQTGEPPPHPGRLPVTRHLQTNGSPLSAGMRRRQTVQSPITKTLLAVTVTAVAVLTASALPAAAAPAEAVVTAAKTVSNLSQVISNITVWLGGLLGGLATLLATVGGVRYLIANGDPGEVMKAKETLKYAGIGYGVAVLAPVLLVILNGFVR